MSRQRAKKSTLGATRGALLWKDIADSMRSQPGRVGLSFFAVLIGIASLTILLAILGGLRERARALVGELGGNVIAIMAPQEDARKDGAELRLRDSALLASGLGGCRISVMRRYPVPSMGTDKSVGVVATDENLADVRGWFVAKGRFLDALDVLGGARHCVLSRALSDEWNRGVGGVVLLADLPFRVVGVIETGATAVEGGAADRRLTVGDRVVFIPRTTDGPWQDEDRESSLKLDGIFVQAPANADVHGLLAPAQRILGSPGRDMTDFSWVTPEQVLRSVRRLQQTLRLAGGSIAFLCLVLGGTTLMSLMVANVRDRVAEIGLRRALGATGWDIAELFVIEACVVTISASIAGQASAYALLGVLGSRFQAPLDMGLLVAIVPFAAAVILGSGFAYWPALLASRISPAEALRND